MHRFTIASRAPIYDPPVASDLDGERFVLADDTRIREQVRALRIAQRSRQVTLILDGYCVRQGVSR
jgi:hypothetical protein